MKKLLSLLLALAMVLSVCVFAVAEEVPVITIAAPERINIEDWNTNQTTLMLEEALGVDIQFQVYPGTDYNTKIGMMIATGGAELPDVIFCRPNNSELVAWIESGVLLPLTKYWEDEALSPNLHQVKARTGVDIAPMMTMYDGEIYAIPQFNQSYNNEYNVRLWINTKWLEQLGEKAPTTPQELHDLLVKVKNTDLNGNGKADEIGFPGNMSGYKGWFQTIMSAFVYAGGDHYYTVNDGKVGYAYTTEGWKEGLKFIKSLFDEELIPREILTQDDNQYLAMLNSEECTSMMFFYQSPSRVNSTNTWRDDFEAYAPLINKDTGKPMARYAPSVPDNGSFFITKNCKNPEKAFAIGDLMVSELYSIMTRWGQEGVDWDYVKNVDGLENTVAWVEGFEKLIVVYDDAKFWSSGEVQNRSYIQTGPFVREYGIANGRTRDPENISLFDKHVGEADVMYQQNAYRPDEVIPKLSYSAEEVEAVSDIQGTLYEFVEEWTANFLAGNMDIDANWDAYLAELENIGVNESLEVVQAVYDRMYK